MLRTGVAGTFGRYRNDTKGNTSMMVRGKNNLRATSTDKSSLEPLIVLDGVIYSGQMTDINPNDIEQIDVLKDASSTAVYGAKAANGVVSDYYQERNKFNENRLSISVVHGDFQW